MSEESLLQAEESTDRRVRRVWSELDHKGVRHLWVFGSRARGDGRSDSDYDFLVEFSSPPDFDEFVNLKLDLEDSLGTPVDLLSLHACPPRCLQAIQPELRRVA